MYDGEIPDWPAMTANSLNDVTVRSSPPTRNLTDDVKATFVSGGAPPVPPVPVVAPGAEGAPEPPPPPETPETHEARPEHKLEYALAYAEQVLTPLKAVKLRVQPGIVVPIFAYDELTAAAIVAQVESIEVGYAAAAEEAVRHDAAMVEAIDEPPIELIVALPVVLELLVDEVVVVVVPLLPVVVVVVDMPVEPPPTDTEEAHEARPEHRLEYALAYAEQVLTPLKAVKLRVQPGIVVPIFAYDELTAAAIVAQVESIEVGYAAAAEEAAWHPVAMVLAAWSWRPGILARCSAARFISMEFLSWRRMPLMEVGRASHRPQRCRQLFMWESVHVGVVCGVLKLSLTAV
jgi:hypothetical protein